MKAKAFLWPAAFVDINIAKSWSVYYWLGRASNFSLILAA
jgi:hypothetical protein